MSDIPCPICDDVSCIYLLMPELEDGMKYFLDNVEVTEAEFVKAERSAGFYNTMGHPEKAATAGFSTSRGGPTGSVSYD